MKALIQILSDGTTRQLDGHDCSLSQAQSYVSGYIENVALSDKTSMLVNEEGLLNDLPVNKVASLMTGRHIVGDVVIVKWEKGDF